MIIYQDPRNLSPSDKEDIMDGRSVLISFDEFQRMQRYSTLGKYCIELIRGGCGPKGVHEHIKKYMASQVAIKLEGVT